LDKDREIWAGALAILRRYGEGASAYAGRRADELLSAGDTEGHRTWIRILERINQLERDKPVDGEMTQ
jgi:triphosphoribosyl-dephospho-CoA synthetase